MTAPPRSLEDVMASAGVDPGLSNNLVQEGWTVESFGLAATDVAAFDTLFPELFPDTTLNLLQKSATPSSVQTLPAGVQPSTIRFVGVRSSKGILCLEFLVRKFRTQVRQSSYP